MDRALKQRLLGAVILTALLVIVVPEWLDGSGHRSRYPGQIEIPDKPVFEPMAEVSNEAREPTARPVPSRTTAETPETEVAARGESAINAWALQVGSFSEESNARVMRDRMRAEGYAAYIHQQKSGGSMHYRVRIGPELDRSRIDKLRTQIQEKHKINGLVVNHP